jgi:hypothetical protein
VRNFHFTCYRPAAAVIGADLGTILAAVTPVPDTLSEYQFAGLLRGRKVELVDCKRKRPSRKRFLPFTLRNGHPIEARVSHKTRRWREPDSNHRYSVIPPKVREG